MVQAYYIALSIVPFGNPYDSYRWFHDRPVSKSP